MKNQFKKLVVKIFGSKKRKAPTIEEIISPSKGRALFIRGGMATGKTLLAKALANASGLWTELNLNHFSFEQLEALKKRNVSTVIFEEFEPTEENLTIAKQLITEGDLNFIFVAKPHSKFLPEEISNRRFKVINL